jgi:hypothetical protein
MPIPQHSELLHAAFEALGANIAVLDDAGRIVATNAAWSNFAAQNGGAAGCGVGENYLEVCRAATGPASLEAQPVADGIQAVLSGRSDRFELEYPCHSPEEERWFVLIVTPLRLNTFHGAVVAHTNSTRSRAAFVAARANEDTRLELGSLGRAIELGPLGFAPPSPDRHSLREGLPGTFASILERYRRLVVLATESQAVKMDEPAEAVEALARELVGLRCGARDVVELHTAAMLSIIEALSPGRARATVHEGRMVLIRLLGLMVNSYRAAGLLAPAFPGRPTLKTTDAGAPA